MNELIKDGGPAFPKSDAEILGGASVGQVGMSLRDWFAGMALQGMIATTLDVCRSSMALLR